MDKGSPYSLYSQDFATFETDEVYDQMGKVYQPIWAALESSGADVQESRKEIG